MPCSSAGPAADEISADWTLPIAIWLYLDAEVLVLPPVFLPQDSVFVGRRLRRQPILIYLYILGADDYPCPVHV